MRVAPPLITTMDNGRQKLVNVKLLICNFSEQKLARLLISENGNTLCKQKYERFDNQCHRNFLGIVFQFNLVRQWQCDASDRWSRSSCNGHSWLTRVKVRQLQRRAEISDTSSYTSKTVSWHTHTHTLTAWQNDADELTSGADWYGGQRLMREPASG